MQQNSGRALPSCCGRRTRCSTGREAPRQRVRLPSPCPPLYRPPRGAPALGDAISQGGRRPGGWSAPQGKWCAPPPPPRVSNPRRRGGPRGRTSPLGAGSPPTSAHWTLRDRWPHPVDPRDPSGGPGTIPGDPETSRWPKQHFLYINLYLRTIPELLVTFGISFGTPNNIRFAAYSYSYNPSVTEP